MKVVVVSGTPGTGKTKIAKLIAKKIDANYVDVNSSIKKNKLHIGYDRRFKSYNVNLNKLIDYLIRLIKSSKENLIIDSHLSHYIPKRYVNLCIITKCDLKKLKKRLEKRGYSKRKVRENLDAEIFDVCLMEALINKHKVRIIDTSKKINIKQLLRYIK